VLFTERTILCTSLLNFLFCIFLLTLKLYMCKKSFKLMLLNFIIQLAEDCISIQNLSLLLCIIIEDFSAERVIFIQCLCILFTVFGSYSLSLDLIHNLWIIFIVVGSYILSDFIHCLWILFNVHCL
jgi:hypothetical protein